MIKKLTENTDGNFKWLLEKDDHALRPSSLSFVVKTLISKVNELIEDTNCSSQGKIDSKLFTDLNNYLFIEPTHSYYRFGERYAIFSDTTNADVFNGTKDELVEFLSKELKRLADNGWS